MRAPGTRRPEARDSWGIDTEPPIATRAQERHDVGTSPRFPATIARSEVRATGSLVIAANRLPVELDARGAVTPSPGGLASALASVVHDDTTWVGWAGPTARDVGPFVHAGVRLQPVRLSEGEAERYYHGFANAVLWPLFHGRLHREEMNRSWWRTYRSVNERFAAAIARVAAHGATVWVHDYHLLLVPKMVRARRPDLRIGLFLHIPFPNPQLFAMLPWRDDVLEGMLGADLVGFQVQEDAENFAAAAERVLHARRDGRRLVHNGRSVEADAFPISVDFARWEELASDAGDRAAALRSSLGVGLVYLGIDRLDYTKGITQRLEAFAELLDEGRLDPSTCVFVQIAVPSRSEVPAYREEQVLVEQLVADINNRHRCPDGREPVQFLQMSFTDTDLVAWYLATDVMVVTSLADGMNLVAKEFVASRNDGDGVLVLSEFAGAAHDLERGALIVNPYDLDAVKRALLMGRDLPVSERATRMHAMRDVVRTHDVHHWAHTFLARLTAASAPSTWRRSWWRAITSPLRRLRR